MDKRSLVTLIFVTIILTILALYDFNKKVRFTKVYICNSNFTTADYRFSVENLSVLNEKFSEKDIVNHTINWARKNVHNGKTVNIFVFHETNFYDKIRYSSHQHQFYEMEQEGLFALPYSTIRSSFFRKISFKKTVDGKVVDVKMTDVFTYNR